MEEFDTISYKLGRAILDAKTFSGLKKLPFKLLELRKETIERKHRQDWRQQVLIDIGRNNFSIEKLYSRYGIEGLNIYLDKAFGNQYELRANKIVELSKILRNKGDAEYIDIARMATYISKSEPILRNFAWCALHARKFEELKETLSSLKDQYTLNNDVSYLHTYKKFSLKLAKLEEQPSGQEHIKSIPEKENVVDTLIYINHKLMENFSKHIEEIYKSYGSKGLTTAFDQSVRKFDLNLEDSAFLLLRIAKVVSQFDKKLEITLIDQALSRSKKEKICKAALDALNKSFEIHRTKSLVREIITHNYSEELKQYARKSHVYAMLIEDLIPAKINRKIDFHSKRICYVLHNSLPYSSGGYATRALGIYQGLKKHGYETIVVNRPGFPIDTKPEILPEDVKEEEKIDGFTYVRSNFPTRKQFKTYDYMRLAADTLEVQFKKYQPEYVIAASNFITAIPAMIAARRLGIPFVYEVRGFWEITRISREPEFALTPAYKSLCYLEALAANSADKVFTLTNAMKMELNTRGVDKAITILPNSCNPEDFTPSRRSGKLARKLRIPSGVPVIGYIGTFVQYEGLDLLAEACGILKEKNLEFRLLMVGNENTSGTDRGPITERVIELAEKHSFTQWLIMPGRVPHEEVEGYYSLIDVAPFPRKPQPVCEMVSPMKPLEASAMKKAIIVSSVRALTEMIVDGETGLVFEKGNVQDLANKLEILISDKNLRTKLGENGRIWVEKERTWDLTTKKLVKIIEGVNK